MKILSLRLKNLNALKGEWTIDFAGHLSSITACLPSPAPRGLVNPRCWMQSAWRCTTRHHA